MAKKEPLMTHRAIKVGHGPAYRGHREEVLLRPYRGGWRIGVDGQTFGISGSVRRQRGLTYDINFHSLEDIESLDPAVAAAEKAEWEEKARLKEKWEEGYQRQMAPLFERRRRLEAYIDGLEIKPKAKVEQRNQLDLCLSWSDCFTGPSVGLIQHIGLSLYVYPYVGMVWGDLLGDQVQVGSQYGASSVRAGTADWRALFDVYRSVDEYGTAIAAWLKNNPAPDMEGL